MNTPSLHQIIGQLFIVGFKGETISPTDPIYEDIAEGGLGGVILFDRHLATGSAVNNITGEKQLRNLTHQLQSLSAEKLFIAVDQEGGRVNRFRDEFGFAQTPPAARLGKADNTSETKKTGAQIAEMLKGCGLNLNLAPVADLNSNKDNPIIGGVERSFSVDGHTVAQHAIAWINSHRERGILTCLKHFPGHGSSKSDSHLGFVNISKSWDKSELLPYKLLTEAEMVDMVMVGHLYNENIDPLYPATLSKETVDNLLRKRMGFNGVVISDDMQMKAITNEYGLEEACIRAIGAGVDLIIIGNNLNYDPQIFSKVKNAVVSAVESGTLIEEQVRKAYRRIQKLKTNIV